MKNTAIYPPLKLIMHPPFFEFASWEKLEQIRFILLDAGKCWQDSIYLPSWGISIGIQMFNEVKMQPNTLFGASIALAILASWRRQKEVYRFSLELEQILYGQAGDSRIPVGILQRLPYSCFYIETPNLCSGKFHGFFVFMDQNIDKTMYILRCLGISPTGDIIKNYDLKLSEGITLEGAIKSSLTEELSNVLAGERKVTLDEVMQEIADREYVISRLLQLILYICAQNSDVTENSKGRTGSPKNTAVIKDKFREIRSWDVGYRIVNRLKRNTEAEQHTEKRLIEGSPTEKVSRQRPRPHIRRSHWHIYWTGKRNQTEREMVIRWINSTLINGKTIEELPVTINRYKQEYPLD